jgi:glutamate 5-kinase
MDTQGSIRTQTFRSLKKVVIKIGTKILVQPNGSFHHSRVQALVKDICKLQEEGISVVLVSSGSIGLGMGILGYTDRPRVLAEKQSCAAVGQIKLMHYYSEKFEVHGQHVAQVLLSGEDFHENKRYNNIRRTIQSLLSKNVIPIINENDTICTAEIIGDNDKLCTDVAHFLEADLLVLLSDEEGLYNKNPKTHKDAELISVVPKITPAIESLGGGAGSKTSVGGMRSKLKAIKQATQSGIPVALTNGKKSGLYGLVRGDRVGTLFLPNEQAWTSGNLKGRKGWLAFIAAAKGKLYLDEGGAKALKSGRSSLLAAGITKVQGNFKVGDFVEFFTSKGVRIGRGKTSYSSREVKSIQGLQSREFTNKLGRKGPEEVVHRNHLVVY